MSETDRQLFHIDLGLGVIMLFVIAGQTAALAFLSASILAGVILIHLKMRETPIPIIDWFLARFERKGEVPGYGSLWYFVGLLLLFSLLKNPAHVASAALILAGSDGLSTLVGVRYGKNPLPYNKNKTLEGSAAFFASSAIFAYALLGPSGIFLAVFATVVESLPLGIDDNLTIPLASSIFLRLFA